MMSLGTKCLRSSNFLNFIRAFSTKSAKSSDVLDFAAKDSFNPKEHERILQTLNQSTSVDLLRFKISKGRVKNITEWKKKHGPFTSLSDVLEVDGFGEKILQDVCQNIIANNVTELKPSKRKIHQYLIPDMSFELTKSVKSAVAVHLVPTGVGWAKLQRENNTLLKWKCQSFSDLPTKMLQSDIFNLALTIARKTPAGDVYIFEAPASLSPHSDVKQLSSHNQQVELYCMLLALLNSSVKHNLSLQKHPTETSDSVENKVFYIRNKLPARLFNTLMGYEKVSAVSKIVGFLTKDPETLKSLPCTPIEIVGQEKHDFLSDTSIRKELLSETLMLAMSFMDLCIYRNTKCYEFLSSKRRTVDRL